MRIHRRFCDLQPTISRLCGYYAVASAIAICHGIDPSAMMFDPATMVQIIDRTIASGVVEKVPMQRQEEQRDI